MPTVGLHVFVPKTSSGVGLQIVHNLRVDLEIE